MTPGLFCAREIPICIFAKPPVPGEVKTRLIPSLGAEGAARLASAMFLDAWHTVESYTGVRPVLATTREEGHPIHINAGDVWLQGEGDLGARIERIMTRGAVDAPAVIAIGADSPGFTAAHLHAALKAIRINDAVIGPSFDGGFYLLGLQRCPHGLMDSLSWSTSGTLRALRNRLEEHAFKIAALEPLFDVDTPGDLHLLDEHLRSHPDVGPATRACLESLSGQR